MCCQKLLRNMKIIEEDFTGEKCPKCGNDTQMFVRFSSLYKRMCSECGTVFKWNLKEGQKGVYE